MSNNLTPLMNQYNAIKGQNPNTILLYRMGDFYEMFNEDAIIASKVLGITLTSRNHGDTDKTPLAGFPYHALDRYNSKLIKAGYKIAICEQTEDPKFAKGIVKREVIEVVTAGTSLDSNYLESGSNNYLASLIIKDDNCGLSYIDISTGEFASNEVALKEIINTLSTISPAEIIIPQFMTDTEIIKNIKRDFTTVISIFDDWRFNLDTAQKEILNQFNVTTVEGFGLANLNLAISSAGAALSYIKLQKKNAISHVTGISLIKNADFMHIDSSTLRNLELLKSNDNDDKDKGSLLSVLNNTSTYMGLRKLKQWLIRPLSKINLIIERLDAVNFFYTYQDARTPIIDELKKIADIERIVGRLGTEKANARDLIALKESLRVFPEIIKFLVNNKNLLIKEIAKSLDGFLELFNLIDKSIEDSVPLTIKEGGLIKKGYSDELDNINFKSKDAKEWIASLAIKERERTGISNLKVNYNKVFGYYIEITNSHLKLAPSNYIRKQTLVNCERYITEELKEWETIVLNADEKTNDLEFNIFLDIRKKVCDWNKLLQNASDKIATLDILISFASVSERQNYTMPQINNSDIIWIDEGRHPVVEHLNPTESFVPNDLYLDNKKSQILMITGPNMAGKSTYLRQVALIVLMAQVGCFVPAKKATIGIVDRIFTRVGASDRLSKGQSTFLVEMAEVANILRNATPKSLILLDEIGRGTSTYDGLSIAWAVSEFLHEESTHSAKTLFATHYHELAELATLFDRVKNYNVLVKETADRVIFLRKIIEGSCDHSYGIEVARLAGVPVSVINRAREILKNLESISQTKDHKPALAQTTKQITPDYQLSFFNSTISAEQIENNKIINAIKKLDIENTTPISALKFLSEIKNAIV